MKTFWAVFLAFFLVSFQVDAGNRHVPGTYPKIQDAIDASSNGDVVIIARGTYRENIKFKGKAITVTSADPDNPATVADTIIDGNNPDDPNFGSTVIFNSGEDTNSVLTGLTITGGTGSWRLISWDLHEVFWNRCGGGVLCYNMSQPRITKNRFINNSAGYGGAIYIYGNPNDPNDPNNPNNPSDPPMHLEPEIIDNVFMNNSALKEHGFSPPDTNYVHKKHGDGGAIVGFQGVDAIVTGNLFQHNDANSYGGAVHLRQWSNGLIENNTFLENTALLGGGIHVTYSADPLVRGNLIKGNVVSSLGGGGIYIYYYSDPLIERNLITENESFNGAGIGIYWDSAPVIRNNFISKNKQGEGIRVNGGHPDISHNTIVANDNTGINCYGDSSLKIYNNIIAFQNSGWGISTTADCNVEIKYNNLWNNPSGNYNLVTSNQTGINGNTSLAPQFVNPDSNDYHLNFYSPCINAGDPNFSNTAQTDYDGQSRVMGQFVDIGADELLPVLNITNQNQYQTIQAAIDDANDDEVIIVTIGRHTGDGNRDIDFNGKAITLQSINPEDSATVAATIIDSNGSMSSPHRAFYFHSFEDINSVINGLTITGGRYAYEGGAIRCYASSPTIKNCNFFNNSARDHGGAIYCGYDSNPIIDNCVFNSNTLEPVGYGGAIYCTRSSPTITNCIITNNSATGSSRHGGGICCWGDQNGSSDPIVANCIVSGNFAGHRGGGLYAYWSSPTFVNCTIIGNKALEGGGIGSFRESNPNVINCIVRNNIAPDGNQIALINTLRVWPWQEITEITISYSDIEGGQTDVWVDPNMVLHWGAGNIDIDPNFVDSGYWDDNSTPSDSNDDFFVIGNYHLLPDSNCINIGDNVSVLAEYPDIDNEQRIFAGTVDIGADEVVESIADFTGNGKVDSHDLKILMDNWLESGEALQGDLVGDDNFIDFRDFAEFASHWLWQTPWHVPGSE